MRRLSYLPDHELRLLWQYKEFCENTAQYQGSSLGSKALSALLLGRFAKKLAEEFEAVPLEKDTDLPQEPAGGAPPPPAATVGGGEEAAAAVAPAPAPASGPQPTELPLVVGRIELLVSTLCRAGWHPENAAEAEVLPQLAEGLRRVCEAELGNAGPGSLIGAPEFPLLGLAHGALAAAHWARSGASSRLCSGRRSSSAGTSSGRSSSPQRRRRAWRRASGRSGRSSPARTRRTASHRPT